MPIQVVWDNDDKTVIRYIIEGNWTWDEMLEAVKTSNAWLDAAEGKIHFIHDMRGSTAIPSGALTQLRRFIGKEHPKTGQSIIVGAQKSTTVLFAQSLLNMIHKIYKRDWGFQFTDTLEEARALLQKREGVIDS